jgi:hypothetical protein
LILKKNSLKKTAALVFALSFLAKFFLTILFHGIFGPYAVKSAETWFYKGVMSGTMGQYLAGGIWDPTYWILYLIGYVVPNWFHLWAVELASIALSSISAVFLFFVVRRLYGDDVGFYSGLIYATMINPTLLSVSVFTHDLVQIPLVLSSIYVMLRFLDEGRPIHLIAYFAILFLGWNVNIGIVVSPIVCGIYAFFHMLKKINKVKLSYGCYFWAISLAFLLGFFFFIPYTLSDIISSLPQGAGGSADVMSAGLADYWAMYNILLFLVPYSAYISYKRGDLMGFAFIFSGVSVASQMVRGLRYADIGFAIISAIAISEFGGGKLSQAKRKNTVYGMLLWSISIFLFFQNSTNVGGFYNLIFLASGMCLIYLFWGRSKKYAVFVICAVSLVAVSYSIISLGARSIVLDAEYRILNEISGDYSSGLVLAGWDRGYVVETISGLKSVSSPNRIRRDIHQILWLPEKDASAALAKRDVKYVFFRGDSFAFREISGVGVYELGGGIVFEPDSPIDRNMREETAIYRMRYGLDSDVFLLRGHMRDSATGIEVMLYEVLGR